MKYDLSTHLYAGDGIPDENGDDRCVQARCGLPAQHRIHVLPPVPEDARRHEARMLGESEDN